MIDLNSCNKVVISRTDAIGDVILTLPLAGVLKKYWPHLKIIFLAKNYTLPIVQRSKYIDEVWSEESFSGQSADERAAFLKQQNVDVFFHIFPNKNWSLAARKAKVPFRVGTSRRWHQFLNCNVRINMSRKKSDLHELELNLMLIKKSVKDFPALENLKPYYQFYGFKVDSQKQNNDPRKSVILHPGSRGSSKDWPIQRFVELSKAIPKDQYKVFISGTEEEGKRFRSYFSFNDDIVDISGTKNLSEFMDFIASVDALVANSTGPLHIAAAVGTHAVGIYPPVRPVHPGRWAPVGEKAEYIVADKSNCQLCTKTKNCFCVESISVEQILYALS